MMKYIALFIAILAFISPWAIIGGLTKFQSKQSMPNQRGSIMAWLVTGQYVGFIVPFLRNDINRGWTNYQLRNINFIYRLAVKLLKKGGIKILAKTSSSVFSTSFKFPCYWYVKARLCILVNASGWSSPRINPKLSQHFIHASLWPLSIFLAVGTSLRGCSLLASVDRSSAPLKVEGI